MITHVLDIAIGTSGQDLATAPFKATGNQRRPIKSVHTNHDGYRDASLLEGGALQTGAYKLNFNVGEYYRAAGMKLPEPTSLDVVILRFGVADTNTHYYTPLLMSPRSYPTYRGS